MFHQITNSLGNYNYNSCIYRNTVWPPHFHGNYELIYTFSGTADVSINGTSETLLPGELLLISPYTVHSFTVANGESWVGVFSPDFVAAYDDTYRYARFSKFQCDPHIEGILKRYLFCEGQPDRFLHISCLYMVCNECVKKARPIQDGHSPQFIREVVLYISEHMEHEVSLRELATVMNYEYHYFSSLFHQTFSMNFRSFINYFRFNKACTLLLDPANSISRVAECCGFGSIRNFNRVFKQLSGYTPHEYRATVFRS